MTQLAELRSDLVIAAGEVARLRAFLAAIAEQAEMREGQGGREREKLAAIRSLASDAADLTAPVPGRVAQLWNEQVEGL